MTRLVALLGSINVGGNRIKMVDLRQALLQRGFTNVSTITASGNVLFDAYATDQADRMAECLISDLGIETFAVILTRSELMAHLTESPFVKDGADNLVHVHFLEEPPSQEAFDQLVEDHRTRGNERLALGNGVLHVDYLDGVGRSKLTGDFIARRLGSRGTARNIRTLRRVIDAMS